MKKKYQKPELELVSFDIPETIATGETGDDYVDGEMGLESSIF